MRLFSYTLVVYIFLVVYTNHCDNDKTGSRPTKLSKHDQYTYK